ncbi:MAG: tetratricopeptide repeat protein, partial [Myxococcota bacterium]
LALREAGLPDRAVREFQRVLRADPEFLDARVQLGLTYYTLGRTEDALEEWRGVLENDPSREDAQMYLRLLRAGDGSP